MPQDVKASFEYLRWTDLYKSVKPYAILGAVPDGLPETNMEFRAASAERIEDVRGREHTFTLEQQGFAIKKSAMPLSHFDADAVEREYPGYVEEIVRELVGSNAEVVMFDWRLRTSDRNHSAFRPGNEYDPNNRGLYINPVRTVHIDQSADGAVKRVRHHLAERADQLLQGRLRVLNLWRPLRYPVQDYPLALCDATTISSELLVKAAYIREDYHGESLYPLQSDKYKWYYLSNQRSDEVLIFKSYDSSASAKARYCPHASFENPFAQADAPCRESIEARVLVFTPE
ncbi:hypothetical protein LTR91_014405 [Friedmanniomyces endolithicus]|uniref:Methyltransferase n=1 Tax=Friedmanniomyces endolithicus TaxID=329885 RepID=A0AAN6QPE3_9PEZI|nr:hypothetical protein LTR75_013169 [Friedmanniomyces endolithicus]KAK0851195.1 hypothetical protein LTS02_012925 [Friedmanniomyces endolithicus]KAK0870636.1 hypothetical protein LTR87_013239 [Friedmanniomyces endolithicus]KAK0893744.1 hypothetical protein LTR02_012672 [Friedmanniomyces endolithicus]KAK0898978.1 hypothetical protein LTR57_021361 [Friedmanniomyces endolithicus]